MYTLTQSELLRETLHEKAAWAVTLDVTSSDAVNFPPQVFVYQVEEPGNANSRAWFTAVASAAQLEEYPADEPVSPEAGGEHQPFYRLSRMTFVTRSPALAQEFIEKVKIHLKQLQTDLIAIEALEEQSNPIE